MPKVGSYGESSIRRELGDENIALEADQMLVGKNTTRRVMNVRTRELLNMVGEPDSELPIEKDKLVCLRNNHTLGLMNGSLWQVDKIHNSDGQLISASLIPEDGGSRVDTSLFREYFYGLEPEYIPGLRADHFDYGYALTVHKSQGSQWDHIVIFDESYIFRHDRWRWLYTAVTRAAEKVDLVTRARM